MHVRLKRKTQKKATKPDFTRFKYFRRLLPLFKLGKSLRTIGANTRLAETLHTIISADSMLLTALLQITETLWPTTCTGTKHHAWRLHSQFGIDKHATVRMDLTNGCHSDDKG